MKYDMKKKKDCEERDVLAQGAENAQAKNLRCVGGQRQHPGAYEVQRG